MSPVYNKKYQKILKSLDKIKAQDFSFSQGTILGSMCAAPHPIAIDAYGKFLDTNLGDPELFPGTKQMEEQVIDFVKTMVHAPKNASGQIVSGGTEGNITAMWIAKQLTGKKEIIIPKSAHFSFQKIALLMDMKLVDIPLTDDYVLNVSKLNKKITDNTAAVIGIAGSTELGTIDPIHEIGEICVDNNVFFHVDAAFGGYIIPFLRTMNTALPKFDFEVKGVSSISVDAHKMGYSAIPLGFLLTKQTEWFDNISVDSPYISVKKHKGILGTRSGGPVAAAYAVSKYLGVQGYTDVVQHCMDVTKYTQERLESIGLNLLINPPLNVLAVKLKNPALVSQKISERGWRVNAMNHLSSIRIVLMPHITSKMIDAFLPHLERVCIECDEL